MKMGTLMRIGMDNRIKATVIGGGYNYSYVDCLVSETYPRCKQKYLKFVNEDTDIRVYLDYPHFLDPSVVKPAKCSIAVTEEPYCILPEFCHFLCNHGDLFDAIFTNQPELLCLNKSNVLYHPGGGGIAVAEEDWNIYPKTEMVCAIFSQKSYTEGHKLRQEIRNDPFFQNHSSLRFINSFPYKENAYKDKGTLIGPYRYNIAIENVFNALISDKPLDCFLTGTIPIYKGNSKLGEYFDVRGILFFDTTSDLKEILNYLATDGEEYYTSMKKIIQNNFENATHLADLSDVLWTHGLENILKRKGVL